jgi:hypothetical protein
MSKRFVEYRGVRMIEGWPERIQEAQLQTTLTLAGRTIARVPYGSERDDYGANEHPCEDCRVLKGEFHVRGCDAEECPECHGQLITCECDVDSTE